jgi:hypothetical protein
VIALALAAIFFAIGSSTLPKSADSGLPGLHKIKTATISPSYSCRSEQDFLKGYGKTALFLLSSSEQRSRPDLLFNGACGSEDYFEGSTSGDDMSMIADLGNEPLEEITTARVFNLKRIHSFDQYSRFTQVVKVQANHTYALLMDRHDVRGLLVFAVTAYEPNKRVDLQYAVKEYQLLEVKAQSDGFSWDEKNQTDCACK